MTFQAILAALLRRWKLILFGTVLTGAVALGVSLLQSPTYEAHSTLAISKSTVTVSLEESLRTLSEEEQSYLLRRTQDLEARREALEGLVASASVAERVAERLQGQLPEDLSDPSSLLKMVSGEAQGDSIVVQVSAGDPEVAALVANAWAQAYEEHINSIYGATGGTGTLSSTSVQSEAADAREEYQTTQTAYEQFMAETQIDEINRRIEEKRFIISSLQQGQRTALEALVETQIAADARVLSAYINAQADNLLLAFEQEQQAKESILREYFAAERRNRLLALQKDRELRERVFTQFADAEIENHLLVLQKDRQLRTSVFTELVDAEIENWLLALRTDRDLRTQVFTELTDAEIENVLLALRTDRDLREAEFRTLAEGQVAARTEVLKQEVDDRIQQLSGAYARRRSLQEIRANAETLLQQLQENPLAGLSGGSEELTLTLLKAQAFASGVELPTSVELILNTSEAGSMSTSSLTRDVEAIVYALGEEIGRLDARIEQESTALLSEAGYEYLDVVPAEESPLRTALLDRYQRLYEVGELAQLQPSEENGLAQAIDEHYRKLSEVGGLLSTAEEVQSASTSLSQAIGDHYQRLYSVEGPATVGTQEIQDLSARIAASYEDLFGFRELQPLAEEAYLDSALLETIIESYPDLFEIGEIAGLSMEIAAGNPMATATQELAQEMLQLQGLEQIPDYTAASAPLSQAIEKLDSEINSLEAALEAENARKRELSRARDLAWQKFDLLSTKATEVDIAASITGTEVRLASTALPPTDPASPKKKQNTVLGLFVGLILSVGFVLVIEHPAVKDLRQKPRKPESPTGPSQPSNQGQDSHEDAPHPPPANP